MRTGAFFGDSGGPAQFRINIGIYLGNRLDDLFRIIFLHNFDRLLFPGGVGVVKLWIGCRKVERLSRTGTERRASENEEGKDEKFSHKERDLSGRSVSVATDFFRKNETFLFDLPRMYERPRRATKMRLNPPSGAAILHRVAGQSLPAYCPRDGAVYLLPGSRR